ncbi:MAG: hypothetical protein R3F59_15720 [Myxococcota bacterium]
MVAALQLTPAEAPELDLEHLAPEPDALVALLLAQVPPDLLDGPAGAGDGRQSRLGRWLSEVMISTVSPDCSS